MACPHSKIIVNSAAVLAWSVLSMPPHACVGSINIVTRYIGM